ncbi:RNA polymerase-associated protein CTR9 [Chlorella vulgaris]
MEVDEATLFLPINGAVVAVQPAGQTVDGLLRILRTGAPITAWLHASQHLLATGREGFEALLSEGIEREQQGQRSDVFGHIQALCSLAEFHVQQAAAERDRRQRILLLSSATELCHKAQRLNIKEQLPELVLGAVALVKNDVTAAKKGFEKAISMRCNGRPSIAPHLALASLHFNQRNYTEALRLYKLVLRTCPSCPAEVRLGIAACCLKAGNMEKAELAYKRTLQLLPNCTAALLGLAVLKLHVSSKEQDMREGSLLLAQAFEQDPENPFVLLLLAHLCLRQGFMEKARQLAQTVLQHGGQNSVQAEALTILARAHHALGHMQEAFRCYQQAAQLDPKLPLPKLGLAQMSVFVGEPINAVSMLESLLMDAPQWIDALQVLGRVYPKTTLKSTKVVPQFKEAAAQRPKDAELWELLGDLLSAQEPAGALKAYVKAIEIRRDALQASLAAEGSSQLPARLLNNAAVLHLRAGNSDVSYALMAEAMQAAGGLGLEGVSSLAQITLGYNMARVKESCGNLKAAEAEYKDLLKQFPQYGDCYLRLACISKARGNTKVALQWAEQAVNNPAFQSDALALIAGLHLERRDYHNAKQVLDKLLGQADSKQVAFAKLAMANLHAYSAPSGKRKDDSIRKAETHYTHALELYRRVLEKDEGCIFAANGIGCVLAELGNLSAAKEVFLQVQEASAASNGFWRMPDAWINLANVYLAQQQYTPAIQMYKNALRKFYDNRNAVIMLYLARAQYDADQMPEATRTLTKALHLAPTDHNLRFDVAVTLQAGRCSCTHPFRESAVRTLQKKTQSGDPNRHKELLRAVRDLARAHRFFQQLHGLGRESGLDSRKLQQHINFIAVTHSSATLHVEKAKEDAQLAEQRQAAAMAQAVAQEKSRQLTEGKKLAEQDAERRRQEEQARSDAERLKQLQEQWRTNATMQKAVATGDASAVPKGGITDGEAALNARVDALFETSEDDDDYVPDGDDDGQEGRDAAEDDAVLDEPAGQSAQLPKSKHQAVLDEDDDADDS